jgi:hypothetical protein
MSLHVNFRELLLFTTLMLTEIIAFLVSVIFSMLISKGLLGIMLFIIMESFLAWTILDCANIIYNTHRNWFERGEYHKDPRCERR